MSRPLFLLALAVALCLAAAGCAVHPAARTRWQPGSEPAIANAAEILREAAGAAMAGPSYQRDESLAAVAEAQVEAGDLPAAAGSAFSVENGSRWKLVMCKVAAAYVRAGRMDEAKGLLVASGETYPWATDRLTIEQACVQAGEGNMAGAMSTVAGIQDLSDRAEGLARVAGIKRDHGSPDLRQAWRNSIDSTLAAARSAEVYVRIAATRWLAVACHRTGEDAQARLVLQEALAVVPSINGDQAAENQRAAMARIALTQALTGDLAGSIETLRQLRQRETTHWGDPVDRERATGTVIHVAIENGQIDQALALAGSIEHFIQHRDEGLVEAATVLAKKGKLDEAASACGRIDSGSRRAEAILKVALVQAQAGDLQGARRTAANTAFLHRELWGQDERFDYQDPKTWPTLYDAGGGFTPEAFYFWAAHAADLAGVSMQLAVLLGQSPQLDADAAKYAAGDVLCAMTQAQTAAGQGEVAVRWARRMPLGEQGARALLGVARGLLPQRIDHADDD